MRLAASISLFAGGPGSGCNPAAGKCGRSSSGTTSGRKKAANQTRCFACDRKLGKSPAAVTTKETNGGRLLQVMVGRECFKHVEQAGPSGWQPPAGGPRLYLLEGVQVRSDKVYDSRQKRSLKKAHKALENYYESK